MAQIHILQFTFKLSTDNISELKSFGAQWIWFEFEKPAEAMIVLREINGIRVPTVERGGIRILLTYTIFVEFQAS